MLSTSRPRRTLCGVAALACASVLVASAPASGAVTIGQLPATPPAAACPSSGNDYLQTSVTGGNLYSARAAGTITEWSTNSSAAGADFTFKVFRRTSDPDFFQAVGQSTGHTLGIGLNTFPANIHVESGDLIGLHAQGGAGGSSCTFPVLGDGALTSPGDLEVGEPPAQFSPLPNVRLNLSAVLVPDNAFTITAIARHRRAGTATLTVQLSNPGLATVSGIGLKKRHATRAVAGSVNLKVAPTGKRKVKLFRTGKLKVQVVVTFYPTGGDPSSQTFGLKLRAPRPAPSV